MQLHVEVLYHSNSLQSRDGWSASTAANLKLEQIAARLKLWCSSAHAHAISVAGSGQVVLHVEIMARALCVFQ